MTKLEALEARAAAPEFWNDQGAARTVISRTNALREIVNPFREIETSLQDVAVMIELAEAEEEDAQRDLALADADATMAALEESCERLETKALLSGRLDPSNAYMTLHAGAGGTESCDWAEMLHRMFTRYCERAGFETETIEYQSGDEAGIKRVTFSVSGPFAYGFMKAERGVHRLVRISPFDANKRRHTSFAALDVVAEVEDDVEVEIDEADLRVDTYRSGGAGGQHVNKTDSAIRITHVPTGLVVACQAERSQHKNRAKAMKILRAKLYDLKEAQRRKDLESFYGEKGEIAWGHQIRSYVLQPYTMVKDHRTNVETSNVSAVLDGDIQKFIDAELRRQTAPGTK